MDEQTRQRLWGLKQLLHDGFDRGVQAIHRYHQGASAKPFGILESIPPLALPVRVVRLVHDGLTNLAYGSIRAANHAIAKLTNPTT
jgi:hypothetical protein